MNRPGGIGVVRVIVLLGAGLFALLLFAAPPQARPLISEASHAVADTIEDRLSPQAERDTPPAPLAEREDVKSRVEVANEGSDTGISFYTNRGVEVRIGPGSGYDVIGLLPEDARLQIVGRDASARWIGIVFAPYTGLTGWVEASAITGGLDVAGLNVTPPTPLKLR